MKKTIAVIFASMMLVAAFAGCGTSKTTTSTSPAASKAPTASVSPAAASKAPVASTTPAAASTSPAAVSPAASK